MKMIYKYIFEDVTNRGSFIYPVKARYLWWVYKIWDVDYFISSPEESWRYFVDIPRPWKVKTVHEARIYWFYEILSFIDTDIRGKDSLLEILYKSVYYDEREVYLGWSWAPDMWSFYISHYEEERKIYIWFYQQLRDEIIEVIGIYGRGEVEDWEYQEEYSYEEYNLLMQMYFWVYNDERLLKELEDKENRWEFKWLEKIERKDIVGMIEKKDEGLKRRLYEYLLLKLSRKSTKWAFEDMEKEYCYWEERLKEMERDIERLSKKIEWEKKDLQQQKNKLMKRWEEVKRARDFIEVYKLLRRLDRGYGKHIDKEERDKIINIVERWEGVAPLPGDNIDKRKEEIEYKMKILFYGWDMFIIHLRTYLNDLIQSKRIYEERLRNKQVKPPKIRKHYDWRWPEEELQKAVDELREELKPTVFRIVEARSN